MHAGLWCGRDGCICLVNVTEAARVRLGFLRDCGFARASVLIAPAIRRRLAAAGGAATNQDARARDISKRSFHTRTLNARRTADHVFRFLNFRKCLAGHRPLLHAVLHRTRIAPALGIALVALACGSRSSDDDVSKMAARPTESRHGGSERNDVVEFASLLVDGAHINYQTLPSVTNLVEYCQLVVVGPIAQLERGGTVAEFSTTVARVTVEEVLLGEPLTEVYVELAHPSRVVTQDLRDVQPTARALWLLQPALEAWSSPSDEGRGELGVPDGELLHAPASPQGVVMEGAPDGLIQPLEPDSGLWLSEVHAYDSIDDLVDHVRGAP